MSPKTEPRAREGMGIKRGFKSPEPGVSLFRKAGLKQGQLVYVANEVTNKKRLGSRWRFDCDCDCLARRNAVCDGRKVHISICEYLEIHKQGRLVYVSAVNKRNRIGEQGLRCDVIVIDKLVVVRFVMGSYVSVSANT